MLQVDAPGQTLRLNGLNGNDPGSRGGSEPVHALATLYDAHGSLIAQSAEVEIPAGEFRSIEFDRDDLPLAGELGTGRVQQFPVMLLCGFLSLRG